MQEIRTYLRDLGPRIGAEFFFVGGCVRDSLLGKEPKDIDLVARGLPLDDLMDALNKEGRATLTGVLFRVIMFHPDRHDLPMMEIALPRTEVSLGSGHNDWDVMVDHALPIEQDLARRDFSVNAVARNVHTDELHDPTGGLDDLKNGVLRAIHNSSFEDDPLRVIRGIRFVAKLGFDFDQETRAQMEQHVHLLKTVSVERFQAELLGMLVQPHVGKALRLLRDIGALPHFIPELQAAVGSQQNKWHDHDVFEHLVRVVENTDTDDPYTRLAALLHDVGKPRTRWVGPDGEAHFYMPEKDQEMVEPPEVPGAHEDVGADMTYGIMTRLRFSSWHTVRVSTLVREHMFARGPALSRRSARRFLARLDGVPGGIEDNVEALFALRYGDNRGGKVKYNLEGDAEDRRFHQLVREEMEKQTAFTVRDLAVNGHDLMQLGLVGAQIGSAQRMLLDRVIDDPELNTREILLGLVQGS